jgi:hypothetical protein
MMLIRRSDAAERREIVGRLGPGSKIPSAVTSRISNAVTSRVASQKVSTVRGLPLEEKAVMHATVEEEEDALHHEIINPDDERYVPVIVKKTTGDLEEPPRLARSGAPSPESLGKKVADAVRETVHASARTSIVSIKTLGAYQDKSRKVSKGLTADFVFHSPDKPATPTPILGPEVMKASSLPEEISLPPSAVGDEETPKENPLLKPADKARVVEMYQVSDLFTVQKPEATGEQGRGATDESNEEPIKLQGLTVLLHLAGGEDLVLNLDLAGTVRRG